MTINLPVPYGGRLVATITADATRTELAYADSWRDSGDRFAISLAMPIREQPYSAELVLPWLMNLLPEGEPLRAMMRCLARRRKMSWESLSKRAMIWPVRSPLRPGHFQVRRPIG